MRTNTIIGKCNVLVKPFICNGEETWCDAKYKTKGVLRIYPETMELEMKIIKGVSPYIGDIFRFLLNDKDVRMLIHMYQKKGRVKPFSMRFSSGMSGREDYYINFPDDSWLITSGKHLLHISCYGKIDGIRKMYIGDFVEAFACFCKKSDFGINYNTSCRYTKPFFASDETITVSKII